MFTNLPLLPMYNTFWCLAQPWCRHHEIQFLMWFKTATFSDSSVQIALNPDFSYRGRFAIDLFCLLIFILSVSYPLWRYHCAK